jgi:hypothetical protein
MGACSGGRRTRVERRHLAEHFRRAYDCEQILAAIARKAADLDLPGNDYVHMVTGVAFGVDGVPGWEVNGFKPFG